MECGIGDGNTASTPSGGGASAGVDIPAGSADLPPTNNADFFREVGTNILKDTYELDDAGLKYYYFLWKSPTTLESTDNIKFYLDGSAKTFVASKKIELLIGVSAITQNENFDKVFTDIASGELTLLTTAQGNKDELSFQKTAGDLGIAAKTLNVIRVKRNPGANDDLVGDYQARYLRAEKV
jgi:hypothetical protein